VKTVLHQLVLVPAHVGPQCGHGGAPERDLLRRRPGDQPGVVQPPPGEQRAGVFLALGLDLVVAQDAVAAHRVAPGDVTDQRDHGVDLPGRERHPGAGAKAGVDDLDADRARVQPAMVLPATGAGVPGPA